jgi:hypothetical protein
VPVPVYGIASVRAPDDGYSCPALAAVSFPVEISRVPTQDGDELSSWLLEHIA